MAKKSSKKDSGVYRVTEVIGTSTVSWEDAASSAVKAAAKSLRDLRVAEVGKLDMKVENGKVVAYRARVSLSFKYEGLGSKGCRDHGTPAGFEAGVCRCVVNHPCRDATGWMRGRGTAAALELRCIG